MIRAITHHQRFFPRRTRRGATLMMSLIMALAFTIPVIQVMSQMAARERHLDLMRGYVLELSTGFDRLDQMVFKEAQIPTSPYAAWFDTAGGLRIFTPPADIIPANRLTDVMDFFTYRDPATDIYIGGAVFDLNALEGDEENTVIEALSVIAQFEDGDFEEAGRRYTRAGGTPLVVGEYVAYFHRFNGLDERYVFRQARARETSNAIVRSALSPTLDLSGHSIRAETLKEQPDTDAAIMIGGDVTASGANLVQLDGNAGAVSGATPTRSAAQTDPARETTILGDATIDNIAGPTAFTTAGLNVDGIDRSPEAGGRPLESRVTGELRVIGDFEGDDFDGVDLTASAGTVPSDGTISEITATQIIVPSNNQTTNLFADTATFTTLNTTTCLGC